MRAPPLGLLALFLVAFMAGCLGGEESSASSAAVESLSEMVSDSFGPGANYTGCRGGAAKMTVPMQVLRREVPPAYNPVELAPALGLIWMETIRCEKIAVGGHDWGGGSLFAMSTAIGHPKGHEPKTGYISRYLFEIRTENVGLRDWLRDVGVTVLEGTVETSISGFALDWSNHSGRVIENQRAVYEYTVFVTPTMEKRSISSRFFFGNLPGDGYFESKALYGESRGDGEGTIQMAENSRLARVFGGLRMSEVSGAWIESAHGQFVAPAQMGK